MTLSCCDMMHIGNRVKEVLAGQGRNARWLASQLPCERSNVYNLFKRTSVGVDLLMRLCVVLGHDFFKELSDELSACAEGEAAPGAKGAPGQGGE